MAARHKKLNPEGTLLQVGSGVRVERGLSHHDKAGNVHPDARPVWKVFRRTDTTDDETTSYDYRYDEVAAYDEAEEGQVPDEAMDHAAKLAEEGE